MLAGKFNTEKMPVQGHVWCLAGDGCMMEERFGRRPRPWPGTWASTT